MPSNLNNISNHGGKRENAGRRPKYHEKTVVMRVPESKITAIKAWLNPQVLERQNHIAIYINQLYCKTSLSLPSLNNHLEPVDLNEHLIHNPLATFIFEIKSPNMGCNKIEVGDQLLIDSSLTPKNNDIVLIQTEKNFSLKYFIQENNNAPLFKSDNTDTLIDLKNEEYRLCGVITCIIRKLR